MDLEAKQSVTQEPILPEMEGTDASANSGVGLQPEIQPQEAEVLRRRLKRIGRRQPVRQAAEAFLDGRTVPPQTTELLLRTLKAPKPYHWRRQSVAAWMLGYDSWQTTDAEAVEKRLIKMVDIWALHNTGYRLLRSLIGGGLLGAVFLITTWTAMRHETTTVITLLVFFGTLFFSLFVGALILPVLALVEGGKMTRIRLAAVAALGRLRSVEALPALARACVDGPESNSFTMLRNPRKMRGMALKAMEEVLPCVTEYDYARLASGIPILCRVLENLATKPRQEPELSERVALLLLSALGKVGDGRAVAIVERVAQKATAESVRTAANGVLPLLQDRKRQESAAHTLLRGSAPNMAAQETLLRAATATEQTDPAQLLRPGTLQISQEIPEPQLQEAQTPQLEAPTAETVCESVRLHETSATEALLQQTSGQ